MPRSRRAVTSEYLIIPLPRLTPWRKWLSPLLPRVLGTRHRGAAKHLSLLPCASPSRILSPVHLFQESFSGTLSVPDARSKG